MGERELPNILMVTSYRQSLKYASGVADYNYDLTQELKKLGCNVISIASGRRREKSTADYKIGIPVNLRMKNTKFPISLTIAPPIFPGQCVEKMHDLVLGNEIDILSLQEPQNPFAPHTIISASPKRQDGKILPCPIGTFHSQVEDTGLLIDALKLFAQKVMKRPRFNGYGLPVGFTKGYYDTLIRSLAGRITVSKATAESAIRIYGKDFGAYEVIPNGIDTNKFNPDVPEIKNWRRYPDEKILYINGRDEPRKGKSIAVLAFAEIRKNRNDVRLVIGGPAKKKLRRLVKRLGLEKDVLYAGHLSDEQLPRAYKTADFYISAATGGEGFGRVLIEALSCGTPIVATNINGYREAVAEPKHDFAEMVEPSDSDSLAQGITKMLNFSKEERKVLGIKGREFVVENYDWSVVGRKVLNYYIRCLDAYGWPKKEDWEKARGNKFIVPEGIIFDAANHQKVTNLNQ